MVLKTYPDVGYIAVAIAGGVSDGTESMMSDYCYQRMLLDISLGAIIGGITSGVLGNVESHIGSNIPWQALHSNTPFSGSDMGDDIMFLLSPWLGTIVNDMDQALGLTDMMSYYLGLK